MTMGRRPDSCRRSRTPPREPAKARERTSVTIASRSTGESASKDSSTIRMMSSGGRLSATYHPISSSTAAAVFRPEPDMPVIRTSEVSGSPTPAEALVMPPTLRARTLLRPVERRVHQFRERRAEAGHRGDVLDGGLAELGDGTEVLHQFRLPLWPKALDAVERGGPHPLRSPLAVVADGEAVRLVADALHEVHGLGVARQDDRFVVTGDPDFLEPLGQPDERDVGDAQFVGPRLRSPDLQPRA